MLFWKRGVFPGLRMELLACGKLEKLEFENWLDDSRFEGRVAGVNFILLMSLCTAIVQVWKAVGDIFWRLTGWLQV